MEAEKVEQKPQELPRFILLGNDELQNILAGAEARKTPRGTQSGLSKLLKIKKKPIQYISAFHVNEKCFIQKVNRC